MKKIFLFLAFLACTSLLFAQPKPSKLKGSVDDGTVKLNKVTITKDWTIHSVVDFLGAAERPRVGFNKTHTYDKYGIVLFEKMAGEKVSDTLTEIQFYFSEMEKNKVTPEGYYEGSFKISKLKVSKDITPADLESKLEGYNKTDSYMEHNFRYAKDGLYIYFQFTADETRLQKISIGRDRR